MSLVSLSMNTSRGCGKMANRNKTAKTEHTRRFWARCLFFWYEESTWDELRMPLRRVRAGYSPPEAHSKALSPAGDTPQHGSMLGVGATCATGPEVEITAPNVLWELLSMIESEALQLRSEAPAPPPGSSCDSRVSRTQGGTAREERRFFVNNMDHC